MDTECEYWDSDESPCGDDRSANDDNKSPSGDEKKSSGDEKRSSGDEKRSSGDENNVIVKDQYDVLEIDEVINVMREYTRNVNAVLKISEKTTRLLLIHFKWDKTRLFESYFTQHQDQFFKNAHVVNPFNKSATTDPSQPPQLATSEEECEICFNQNKLENTAALACGHRYCTSCWRTYLTAKIEEGECQSITCAAHKCDIVMDDETLLCLIIDEEVKHRYQYLNADSFVKCNKLLRWCPKADCNHVIRVENSDWKPILCKCGETFCCECDKEWHGPVNCRLLRAWLEKLDNDLETSSWIASFTKKCPKCMISIEKNGGCNHIRCMSRTCNHEFCWVCLGPWEEHDGEFYVCSRYRDGDAISARTHFQRQQHELVRYVHYQTLYKNHKLGLTLESKLHERIDKLKEILQNMGETLAEMWFLNIAVDTLRRSRTTLMYTYVFAYYLERTNQSAIFEDNQNDLERATDKLARYFQRQIVEDNMTLIKSKIVHLNAYCKERCKVLSDHVVEGYENKWWKFIE